MTAAIASIPSFSSDAAGVITGRIVDSDGNTIGGVEVIATTLSRPDALGSKAEDASFEDDVCMQVQYYRYQRDARRVATSDASGQFELTAIGPGRYRVAYHHGSGDRLARWRFSQIRLGS